MMRRFCLITMLSLCASPAFGGLIISEYMYQGAGVVPINQGGEFIELTNYGATPLDMTGYSFDDDSNIPGSFLIGGFGVPAPNESVIITDIPDTDFRTAWGLSASVKVIGGNNNNLSRNDQINIYDASNALAARLSYGDQTYNGTIRTQNKSGWPNVLGIGADPINLNWILSTVADAQNSWSATYPGGTLSDIGNP